MTRRQAKRAAIYAAIIVVPWLVVGAATLLVARCASGATMQTGEAVAPPAAAISWAVGQRYAAHAYPDCNDYTVAAMARLTAVGEHPRAAVAILPNGEGHMVATFDYRGETYVVTNGSGPIPWESLDWVWVSRQDGLVWRAIINGAAS